MKKKIIIIIFLILFISGCYDYVEINNLVIISGIGIDYNNEKYIVTIEALYNEENNESSAKGKTVTRSGKTLTDAFNNISLTLDKEPYLAHLKVIVISTEIANNHMNSLFDFFLRNNQIRNIFNVVIADNSSPKEILETTDKTFKVSSEKIKDLLENNQYSNYISKNTYFKKIVSDYLSKEKNITLSSIKKTENTLSLGNLYYFDNKKIKGKLTDNEASILSLLDNKKLQSYFKYKCKNNKYVVINVYNNKPKIIINKNEFIIKNNIEAEVIENDCNINLEKNINQKKLSNKFENIINNKTEDFVNKIKINNADILGINNKYYLKYREKNKTYFKNANFKIKTNINVNKKGLIFEVKNDN